MPVESGIWGQFWALGGQGQGLLGEAAQTENLSLIGHLEDWQGRGGGPETIKFLRTPLPFALAAGRIWRTVKHFCRPNHREIFILQIILTSHVGKFYCFPPILTFSAAETHRFNKNLYDGLWSYRVIALMEPIPHRGSSFFFLRISGIIGWRYPSLSCAGSCSSTQVPTVILNALIWCSAIFKLQLETSYQIFFNLKDFDSKWWVYLLLLQ